MISIELKYKIQVIDLVPNIIDEINEKFDVIICGFCMPYLSKIECSKLIQDSANLLNPDGLFYMSTMDGEYENSGLETTSFSGEGSMFITYHQSFFLKEQLNKFGFEVLDLIRKKYLEADGVSLTDMIFIARKNNN